MFTGSLLGAVITFTTLPILTRIYNHEEFGNFQIIVSVIALFASISSFKYEMAIVLPKQEEDANKIISVSLLILIFTTVILSVIFMLFGQQLFNLLNVGNANDFTPLIIIGIFITGLYQISANLIIRQKKFGQLSSNGIIRPIISNIGGITVGLIKPTFFGLYISQILGQIIITIFNFRKSRLNLIKLPKNNLKNVLNKYKKFAFINSPLEFINTYSLQLPVLLITFYFGAGTVGIYMVAERLLNTPLNIIGQSFQKVYYKEASDAYQKNKDELLITYKNTVKKLAIIGVFPLLTVLLTAQVAVKLVLGDEWIEAGVFMQILMVGYYFRLINAPVSITFSIIKRQEIGLILVIVSLCVRWGSMVLFSQSIYSILTALMVSSALFYFIYTLFIFYFIKRDNNS